MKKIVIYSCLLISLASASYAQETVTLAEQAGLKVSYQATKLEGDNKKHDKWSITMFIDNDGPQDVVFIGENEFDQITKKTNPPRFLKIEITNTKGFFATSYKEFRGEAARVITVDGGSLFRVRKGRTTENFNTNIDKDAKPALKSTFFAQLKPANEVELQKANPAELVMMPSTFTVGKQGETPKEVESISIFTVDNKPAKVMFDGAQFLVGLNGDFSNAQKSVSLDFLAWDRSKMTAKPDLNGNLWKIKHYGEEGPGNFEGWMNYMGSDGYNYTTKLNAVRRNKLVGGTRLGYGETPLTSANGVYKFEQIQDGSFNLSNAIGVIWSINLAGKVNTGLSMQPDGNAVIYLAGGSNAVLWATGTDGVGSYMLLQNDGNLVIYRADGVGVWSSRTKGK